MVIILQGHFMISMVSLTLMEQVHSWEYTDSRAVRMEGITAPREIWNVAEWEIGPANILDTDPGTHHGSAGGDTIPSGSYSLTVQSDTIAVGQSVEVSILVSELNLKIILSPINLISVMILQRWNSQESTLPGPSLKAVKLQSIQILQDKYP